MDTQGLSEEQLDEIRASLQDDAFQEFLQTAPDRPVSITGAEPLGRYILPTPGFVVKTKTKTDRKVFLNIVACDAMAAPSTRRGLVGDHEEEGINIPLSVSAPREDVDRAGAGCSVIDAAVSPVAIDQARVAADFKELLCMLAIQWASNKHQLDLSDKYSLPKTRCKGNPMMQLIRADGGKTRVQEATTTAAPRPSTLQPALAAPAGQSQRQQSSQPQPQQQQPPKQQAPIAIPVQAPAAERPHMIQCTNEGDQGDGRPATITVTIAMAGYNSLAGIELEACLKQLWLEQGGHHLIDIALPFAVDGNSGRAKFDRTSQHLQVTVDVLSRMEERTQEALARTASVSAPASAASATATKAQPVPTVPAAKPASATTPASAPTVTRTPPVAVVEEPVALPTAAPTAPVQSARAQRARLVELHDVDGLVSQLPITTSLLYELDR
eukprot:TRINITY_DN9027_c0_g1_i2.p1 TRINITY_DN9027_c0_g1~~TRINITY_DN9027_c0_g1_i2.p1  ORF type:complete len:440 (-),score=109.73 TRINITY_DN9027_c0_g1_i2:191-1510(-)